MALFIRKFKCFFNKDRYKKKKSTCTTWDEINKSESDDPKEERESLNCFMVISNEVTILKSKLDNCIDRILSFAEFSHAFNELHKDMTSPSVKNKAFKVKCSSLSKEIALLKGND